MDRQTSEPKTNLNPSNMDDATVSGDTIKVDIGAGAQHVVVGKDITVTTTVITEVEAYNVHGLPNPYLGLRSFTYADRAAYAGRTQAVQMAVEQLTAPGAQQTILFVTGASGSGKSSFAQAGLLPALETYYAMRGKLSRHAVFRPGERPMALLDDALAQLGVADQAALATLGQVNLLVIDQFEEIFTQSDTTGRNALFQWLAELPPFDTSHIHIIATIRADYLNELFEIKPLYDLQKQGIELRSMSVDELETAIQCPLQNRYPKGEKRFEPTLVTRLAQDAAANATLLPLLQVTLEEIWKKGQLTLDAYSDLADAIKQRADQVYAYEDYDNPSPVVPRSAVRCAAILNTFLDLVNVSLDDNYHRDVRISRARATLATDRQPLIDDLSHARLLSVSVESNVETVTIIHETLIANWSRLHQEVEARRQQLQQRVRFEQQMRFWLASNRADDYLLLTNVQLAEAHALAAADDVALQSDDARALLQRSNEHAESEQRQRIAQAEALALGQRKVAEEQKLRADEQTQAAKRLRWLVIGLLAAGLIATGLAWRAIVVQNQVATKNQEIQSEQQIGTGRELLAQGAAEVDEQPDLGILLVGEGNRILTSHAITESLEVKSRLLTTLLSGPRPLKYLHGHTGPVLSVTFSPDSQWIASASNDGTIRINSVVTSQSLYTLTGHTGAVNSVAFAASAEQPLLASGGADGTIRLWQWQKQEISPTFIMLASLHKPVHAVAFSPTEMKLATGGDDQIVRLWDVATGKLIYTLAEHTGNIYALAFSHDGTRLASTDSKNDLRLWDVATGKSLNLSSPQPDPYGQEWMHGVTFSPTDQYVVTGSGNFATFYDNTGNLSQTLIGHSSIIRGLAFSADGTRFATASEDWRIGYCYLYSSPNNDYPNSCQASVFLNGHGSPVNSVAFSADNRWLASGGEDGNVLLWNAQFPYVVHSLAGPMYEGNGQLRRWNVEGLAFSPDSKTLASSSWDGAIRLWDMETGEFQAIWPNQGELGRISMSPDGTYLAFGATFPPHRIWRLDGTVQMTLPITTGVASTAFSPDGLWIATDDQSGHAFCLWSLNRGLSKCQTLSVGFVDKLAFSPNGRSLASNGGTDRQSILLWDITQSTFMSRTLGHHDGAVFGLAFNPDGNLLASAGSDYTVRLWDITKPNTAPRILRNRGRFARNVTFSPDGQMLVSVNENGTVRWWDVETGQPFSPIQTRFERLDSAAFSPNGRWLATGSYDGLIDLWPGNLSEWKKLPCQIANRNLTAAEWAFYVDNNKPQATCPDLPVAIGLMR